MKNTNFFKNIFGTVVIATGFIYLAIQLVNIPGYQEKEINKILDKIASGINSGNATAQNTVIKDISEDAFIALFIKDQNGKLAPLIYDQRYFSAGIEAPVAAYKTYHKMIAVYPRTVSGHTFVVWMNKLNINYYIKYIVIPLLVILLIYIIGAVLIITFTGRQDEEPIEADEFHDAAEDDLDTELYGFDQTGSESETTETSSVPPDLHESYKNLWVKNFKISDEFKNSFPFVKIIRLLRFSYRPEEYINKCVAIATEYFKWQNQAVYIAQKDEFIDSKTKELLDKNAINIPEDGSSKGDIYIPLYPYNKTKLFGYLKFQWHYEHPFFIADILYFLKFAFSQDARVIFTNYKNNDAIKEQFEHITEHNQDVVIGFIEVDSKERYKLDLSPDEKSTLDAKILDDVTHMLSECIVFQAFPFVYGFFKAAKLDDLRNLLELFSARNGDHNYYISPVKGNIAVTFSIGVASKRGRSIGGTELMAEAEEYLSAAIENGGDQITGK